MAEDANNLPFKQELELAKYLTGIFGNSEKANPNYSGKVIKPDMVPEMSPTDMNAVMTEWLRGNGQFLDKMREQNLSGLFNTSTQKLMANDLTAQAALKAAQLNTNIKQGNTQLANAYYSKVSTQPSKTIKGGGLSNTEKAIAMILSALNQGEAKKGSTTKKGKDGSVSPDREQNNLDKMMGAIGGYIEQFMGGGQRGNAAEYSGGAEPSYLTDSPASFANFGDNFAVDPVSYGFDLPEFSVGINPSQGDPLADLLYKSMNVGDAGTYDFDVNPVDYGFGSDFSLSTAPEYSLGGYGTSYAPMEYDYNSSGIYDFGGADYSFGGGGGSSFGEDEESYYYDD